MMYSIPNDTAAVFNREYTREFLVLTNGNHFFDTPIFDKLVLEKGIHL